MEKPETLYCARCDESIPGTDIIDPGVIEWVNENAIAVYCGECLTVESVCL